MARLRNGSPALIRDLNRTAILSLIGAHGPIARAEIARRLALSPATVTGVTRDLADEGLVRVVDQAPSSGGRPALLLGLIADAGSALGVKIAADHLAAVRIDLDGEVLAHVERPFDATSPAVMERLGEALEEIVATSGRSAPRLLGIGLGVPGIVDAQRGGAVDAPALGWRSLPLGTGLQDRLGLPVLVDNDVNTLAVAERLYGRGRTVDHFVTVTIGRGVGLGIVVAGDLHRGARGGAGEFGHVSVADDGPQCECGKRGCLEALVADPALCRQAREAGLLDGIAPAPGDVDRLRALADAGDQRAREIYARAGTTLGRAVAGLVNILSPQLVLVSGEGTQAWLHLAQSFEGALRRDTFGPLRDVPVEVDPWDDAKWARGAAALVLRAPFSAPLYERQLEDAVRARLGGPPPVDARHAERIGEPAPAMARGS